MRFAPVILALVLLSAPAALAGAARPAAGAPVIDVTATADQTFTPATIVLHVRKKQVLRFTSTGGVHGIESKELGIPATMIMPGKPVSVTVTPAKAGTYKLPCTIVCGPNHATMLITVDVKR